MIGKKIVCGILCLLISINFVTIAASTSTLLHHVVLPQNQHYTEISEITLAGNTLHSSDVDDLINYEYTDSEGRIHRIREYIDEHGNRVRIEEIYEIFIDENGNAYEVLIQKRTTVWDGLFIISEEITNKIYDEQGNLLEENTIIYGRHGQIGGDILSEERTIYSYANGVLVEKRTRVYGEGGCFGEELDNILWEEVTIYDSNGQPIMTIHYGEGGSFGGTILWIIYY